MGTTTFTGPITAGTILNTTGTTVGQDVSNVGYVAMSQSVPLTQATNVGNPGVYQTLAVLPAGSQIVGIDVFVTTAWNGAATTINLGFNSTATQLCVAADNDLGITLGRKTLIPGNDATRTGNWIDVGTSDVQIWAKSTNTGAGVGILVLRYQQAVFL